VQYRTLATFHLERSPLLTTQIFPLFFTSVFFSLLPSSSLFFIPIYSSYFSLSSFVLPLHILYIYCDTLPFCPSSSLLFSALLYFSPSETYAMTDEAADRIRLPQKWYIIKIRNNKRKGAWARQEEKINNPTFYDENGTRIKFDEEGESGDENDLEGVNSGDYDEGEDEDNSEGGESDGDGDGGMEEMNEEEYERKMMEKSEALLEAKNARIEANNKREEDIMMRKQFDKKKGRNVMVRTLSGEFIL
jgi:hypothetical protein